MLNKISSARFTVSARQILAALFFVAIGASIAASGGCLNTTSDNRGIVQQNAIGGTYRIQQFLEVKNIDRRLELFDDVNLITWIYQMAWTGQVIDFQPVQGKITSSTKRLEPSELSTSVLFQDEYTLERIGADYTFGASDAYVFWFDPSGVYHQWNGLYKLESVPFKIRDQVINYRDVDSELDALARNAHDILERGGCVDYLLNEIPCSQAGQPSATATPGPTATP